jgi:peptidyl-prolyl cis-trans isomerase B (cyclophilin B)
MIRKLLFALAVISLIACNNEVKKESGETAEKTEKVEEKVTEPEKEVVETKVEVIEQEEIKIAEPTKEIKKEETKTRQAPPKETLVLISTTMGDITVKLYNETPKHRDNFIKLIKEGWYDDSPFHRVMSNFMIQGGHNKDGRVDAGYTIPANFNQALYHKKGALAAARMPDQVNPNKESSGCQFYIVQGRKSSDQELTMMEKRLNITYTQEQKNTYKTLGGYPSLDMEYTVFGEVVKGLDVVDKIAVVKTGPGNVPVKAVTMKLSIVE